MTGTTGVDLLVLGTGMAGSTVAARASELGRSVLMLDIAGAPGGSAALSGGNVWTVPTEADFRHEDPTGQADRWRIIRENLDEALAWLASLGVASTSATPKVHDAAVGRHIDVVDYLARCRSLVERVGGSIAYRTTAARLLVEDGRVVGATLSEDGVEVGDVRANAVVLATGGFQADPDMRDELLYPGASRLLLRGNPHSRGGGIKLARSVGADYTAERRSFYGQLVPSPLRSYEHSHFRSLALFFSVFGVLLGRDGRRFIDESVGSHKNANAVGPHDQALLVLDDAMRRATQEAYGTDPVQMLEYAASLGCRVRRVDDTPAIGAELDTWGYPGVVALGTITDFNQAMAGGREPRDADRWRHRISLATPPFWVLETRSAITIAYGGLVTDPHGRVLRPDGSVIAGLYAAGIDAAGPNADGYTGSLARGLVYGLRVATAAVDDDRAQQS